MAGAIGGATSGTGAVAEWRSNWRIILPATAGIMLCSAHGYTLGVMVRPLELEFGWQRAEISAGFLIIALVAVLVSPLVGIAVDRIGARRIGLGGILFYCSALAILSTTGADVASWWLRWALLAIASMTVLPVVWLAVVNGYFVKSRGLAMAVCLSGTGIGAAVFPMLTNTLVEAYGWRGAYMALAGGSALVCFPLAFILFHPAPGSDAGAGRPADRNSDPAGSAKAQMRTLRFFKLAAASVIFSLAACALTNNFVPVLLGEGLTPAAAAATAGLLGIGSIAGRLGGGFLLDRFDANKVAAISVLVPIIPITILLVTDGSQQWAALACLVMGLSVGTELDANAYLVARHFGTRNFGALFGTINGFFLLGNGVAPIAANHVYDLTRTYDLVLIIMLPLCVVAAGLFLSLGRHPELEDHARTKDGFDGLAEEATSITPPA